MDIQIHSRCIGPQVPGIPWRLYRRPLKKQLLFILRQSSPLTRQQMCDVHPSTKFSCIYYEANNQLSYNIVNFVTRIVGGLEINDDMLCRPSCGIRAGHTQTLKMQPF